MPKNRRYIESKTVYEICFRAKDSLPLVAYQCINFVIQCILARVQRDEKVILCHDIWNGSHPHIIVVSKDAEQLVKFYGEVEKKITDILKRLLGLSHLEIWDGEPSVIKIGDLEAAKERIAYLYANPAQDNLEDSIENFPGASSWSEFQQCLEGLEDEVSFFYPWIRLPAVPRLSGRIIDEKEDLRVLEELKEKNKQMFILTRSPNAWMKSFGVTKDSDVKLINSHIISQLRAKESAARERRIGLGKALLGKKKLKNQPILKPHKPKKNDGKIFIITTINEVRLEFIKLFERFVSECKSCLARWRKGELSVKWPPEAFKPPLPPIVSVFGDL